jgi:hypothetical protein
MHLIWKIYYHELVTGMEKDIHVSHKGQGTATNREKGQGITRTRAGAAPCKNGNKRVYACKWTWETIKLLLRDTNWSKGTHFYCCPPLHSHRWVFNDKHNSYSTMSVYWSCQIRNLNFIHGWHWQ